jgi:uncharacterized RDD family membrane protein YckC
MGPEGIDGASSRPVPSAGLARRFLALMYEALLLVAWLLAGSLPYVVLTHGADRAWARPLFQLYLGALSAVYLVWQWRRGGQTLAMKTWRLRLVTRDGAALGWSQAVRRFLFALPGTAALGAGFLWALVDREGLFLHDRLAGTRIVNAEVEIRNKEG